MERERIGLLAEIGRTISNSTEPGETLRHIVTLVADQCGVDVCSVYFLDEEDNMLVLRATLGLRPDAVGSIRMRKEEGLTGLVLEQMAPVFVIAPAAHPRYKYFAGSGEETYETFLGLPLAFQQKVLGVLVIQTIAADGISEKDIPVFVTIAGQIAAVLAYGGILEGLEAERGRRTGKGKLPDQAERGKRRTRERRGIARGTGVSPGVADGRAHYLGGSIGFEQVREDRPSDAGLEQSRLAGAFQSAEAEIVRLIEKTEDLASEDKAIVEAHLMFLRDKELRRKVEDQLAQGHSAEFGLKKVISGYMERFLKMDNPYLRERRSDVEDIGKRVLGHLLGVYANNVRYFHEDTVVVATDISPVDLVSLRQPHLKGIVLSRGGRTSHSVILAKSFEIPMVIGAREVFDVVRENDKVILDGTSGLIFDEPPAVIVDEYARLRKETDKAFERLDLLHDAAARTQDGFEIKLGANIGLLSDLDLVEKYGADHIGLYRTEFPFLMRKDFPSEEEQTVLYRKIVAAAGKRSVNIRTLDVGGDKFLPYLDSPKEQNPYLGWRSIRVSLDLDDMFRTQIRAILMASEFGNVSILFPMITAVREIRKAMEILSEEKQALSARGIPFDERLSAGVMIEVPAAARILHNLLPYVDFVSVGTNDLVQYLLAVDRNNARVADIYNPLHPAVIDTIGEVVAQCKSAGKTVSVCGEAASSRRCAYLFLAMGADRLSMNAASVPVIKDFVRRVSRADARKALAEVRSMADAEEIGAYLRKQVNACYG